MSNTAKKNILVISPIPTHPLNRGNRIRLFNLLHNIKDIGHEIFFLYVNRDNTTIGPLKEIWGDNFIAIQSRPKQQSFYKKVQKRIKEQIDKNSKYLFDVDEWYDDSIDDHIKKILAHKKFDIVLAVYVYMSKALELFDENVLKIIDTNDKFTDRHLKFYKAKIKSRLGFLPHTNRKKKDSKEQM